MKRIILLLLLFCCSNTFAAITDGKFGINQIFDVQYYWSGTTLNASNFIAPYNKNFQTVTTTAGQYFQFFNSTTNPGKHGLKLMNSNGTQHSIVHDYGDITALGSGAIFYLGSGWLGNVITTGAGYSYGSSAQFTNMDTSVTSTDLNNYTFASSTPLAAGQTAAPPAPAYGTNFTRITSYEWKTYAAGSQPLSQEQAHEAFDNNNGSKWFGLRSQGAWAVVQFVTDGTYSSTRAVQRIQFVTANDASGRDPTGFKVWGSINGTDWVLVSQQAISLPAGRLAESTVYSLSNVTAFSYYKIEFTGVRDGGDAFQIAEIRLIYDVDDQQGTLAGGGIYTPPPLCCGGSSAAFNANSTNTAKVLTFTNRTTADSKVNIEQLGTQNEVTVNQSGTQNNYVNYYGNGLSNNIDITQQGNATTQVNYTDLRVVGNFNTVNIEQTSIGGSKGVFVNVQNNNNALILKQQDNGSHYAEVNLSGGNKTVDILQEGSGNHMASVTLTGPQPSSLNLIQSGSTQQFYSITNNCATAGGCAPITVTQGR